MMPFDLDGLVDIVVDIRPRYKVYDFVGLVNHLVSCPYAKYGGRLQHIFVRKHFVSVLASDTMRPNATHTTTTAPIIFLSCTDDCATTPVWSA